MIIIVLGFPGSGESYFALRLAAALGADYISSDRLRKATIANRTYSEKERRLVYDQMLQLMGEALGKRKDLILDATFYKNSIRKKFLSAAQKKDNMVIIEIISSEDIIAERLNQPRQDSEADFKVYKIIQAQWEPIKEPHLVLQSTNDNLQDMLAKAIQYLESKRK